MRVIAGGGIGLLIFMLPIFTILRIYVVPKFMAISEDMLGTATVPLLALWDSQLLAMTAAVLVLVLAIALYLFTDITPIRTPTQYPAKGLGVSAWLEWFLPWRRMRLERDFSALLAAFLDAGMPEEKALHGAADALGNRHLSRFIDRAIARLKQGKTITEVLDGLDESEKFAWRWRNAARAGKGFTEALRGWQDSLEARAFFKEQAVAQVTMSALIVANGAFIALVGAGFFQMLIAVIDGFGP